MRRFGVRKAAFLIPILGVVVLAFCYLQQLLGWSVWTIPVGIVICVLMIFCLVVLIGRYLSKNLRKAMEYLETNEWDLAIAQISQIDPSRVKGTEERVELLFYMGFANYMAKHLSDAKGYIAELLTIDNKHKAGLYFMGYMALEENDIISAEKAWRELYMLLSKSGSIKNERFCQDAYYYLCLTLYRKSLNLMDTDNEEAGRLITEIAEIGALDEKISDIIVQTILYRSANMIQQGEHMPKQELDLAIAKLRHLDQLMDSPDDVSRLKGLCYAARAILDFTCEEYEDTIQKLSVAYKEIQGIISNINLFDMDGISFIDQLLRTLTQKAKSDFECKISPIFVRDIHFLAGICQLRVLHRYLSNYSTEELQDKLLRTESSFERSLSAQPDFNEGLAILGLLYYYLSTDEDKKNKGIEILLSISNRFESEFVKQTVNKIRMEKKTRSSIQEEYFDRLKEYSLSNDMSRERQVSIEILRDIKAMGEYRNAISEDKPENKSAINCGITIQEIINRVALLREKLKRSGQLKAIEELSEVTELTDGISKDNRKLADNGEEILKIEQKLIMIVQRYL
jgi:hypothetical protein